MSRNLAEYLDDEGDAEVDTPKLDNSLEARVRRRFGEMGQGEIESIFKNLESEHPKLFARLQACLESVQAVHLGHHGSAMDLDNEEEVEVKRSKPTFAAGFRGQTWFALSRFIPLRLSAEERRILAILDRTLKVSEYTDNVDIYLSKYNRSEVMRVEIEKIQAVLSGQYIAMKMAKSTGETDEAWYGEAFEIGRRYKAMNPDRMRETHVKLMYMLQDSRHIVPELGQTPIKTVLWFLTGKLGGADEAKVFLQDKLIDEFVNSSDKASIANEMHAKFRPSLTLDEVELVLNSVKDYAILIESILRPVSVLLDLLEKHFDPKRGDDLSIRSGSEGARLSHSHAKQFQFVSQSLKLWKEVLTYFMPLWLKAEEDLLGSDYRLADTGQGLNRVQSAPRTASLMGGIVDKVQRNIATGWIGSSVVHLGDHNVPNALVFLDKYCQIPRILGPIAHTLTMLPKEYETLPPVVQSYIDKTFGGVEECQRKILADFFKHGFDGSGADNYYDAGSCIDGRLTSAWNWCSKIEKKTYFPVFLLTHFLGFDGDQQSYT